MATLRNSRVLWVIPVIIALFALSPVRAQAQDGRPVADAGSSRYAGPDPIVLDGTSSYDPDNSGTLSYTWRQISGPAVTIMDANTATPTISGFVQTEEIQECEFELIVNDGELTSLSDDVKVSIVPTFNNSVMVFANEGFGEAFDPQKPTIVYFGGGLGGWVMGGGRWSSREWREKANVIIFDPYLVDPGGNMIGSLRTFSRCADMIIVFLSAVAPDYKGAIQTMGWSLGSIPAIDVALRLNKTYADVRYAVNRVTFLDDGGTIVFGYDENSARAADFIANPVDGEQCWLDSYNSSLGAFYPNALNVGFQLGEGMWEDTHGLANNWYRESLTDGDMNVFNHGVIAGSYWSVVGPGRNLQLASTTEVQTYKLIWHGDSSSGYMDSYDDLEHPGRLPEPITLVDPIGISDTKSVILTCRESENAIGYQLLLGPDPYRVMDYMVVSDTSHPPNEVVTDLPFEETWWTVRARDQYGSTIYADPVRINLEDLTLFTIDNLNKGRRYGSIQLAINDADPGDEIRVGEGIYRENISIEGKNLTVTSINPNDPTIVAATIINGVGQLPVVSLSRGQGPQGPGCVLAGLTITGGTMGISCGNASPTIRNCTIESIPISIEYFYDYEPTIVDCTILGSIMGVYDPSLVALWKMDETDGSIAHDSIGTNDGICNGEPVWQPAGGKSNGALQLDGIDDYVSTPFLLDPALGAFSVFAWIKGGAPGQIVMSQTDGENWLLADPSGGNLMTELKGTVRGAAALLSQTAIADGNWHRLGFVWDGSDRTLYVDDVEVARDTQTDLGSSEGSLHFGAGSNRTQASFFSGLIDDIRIYNRAVCP